MHEPLLSGPLSSWLEAGELHAVLGHNVFVRQAGAPDAPPLLILHGFPSCSFDFHRVMPFLSEHFRIIIHDHLGFGLSDKPGEYSYSLLEQAEVALELWRQLGITHGHLLAHDYGTSVATEILARKQRRGCDLEVDSLTLTNGSVHIELARLSWSQLLLKSPVLGPPFARLSSRTFFKSRLRDILGMPDAVPDEDLDALWDALVRKGGRTILPRISIYLDERRRFWHRWIGALRQLSVPALVLWGRADPIAVAAIADALLGEIPGAQAAWLEDVGHYPMLEAPERWAAPLIEFLLEVERARAAGAMPIGETVKTFA